MLIGTVNAPKNIGLVFTLVWNVTRSAKNMYILKSGENIPTIRSFSISTVKKTELTTIRVRQMDRNSC